ncbi:MAG: formylglycine-generating enzyme family protein [Bryobacteraceae bacterium]
MTAFEPFLAELQKHGIVAGLDRRLRLAQALDAWQGEYPPARLKTLLCPIFATSKEEQEVFGGVFDRSFPRWKEGPPEAEVRGGRDDAAEVDRGRGLGRWLAAAGFVVVLLALSAAAWKYRTPELAPLPPPRPVAAPAWSLLKPYADIAPKTPPRPPWRPLSRVEVTFETPASLFRWWWTLLLAPLLLVAGVEAWAWRRRRVILESAAGRPPAPSSFGLVKRGVRTAARAGFGAALRRLRRPAAGPQRLSTSKTVRETIRANGFPDLRYDAVFRRPEYLVLIDRASPRDHQAQLYEELAEELDRKGLRVEVYRYAGDPRVCRSVKTGRAVYLADLYYRTADHRLIVFGDGERLVSEDGQLTVAGEVVSAWRERGLLTPASDKHSWGVREKRLSRHFRLAAASTEELANLVERFDPDRAGDDGQRSQFPGDNRDLEHATPEELKAELRDPGLYRWLCACALYPQLQWDVTLQLGAEIDPALLSEGHIERLTRLPWFRHGWMPVAVQERLADSLTTDERLRLREAVLRLLEVSQEGGDEIHRLEIAIQRLDLRPAERQQVESDSTVAKVVEHVAQGRALIASPALQRMLFPLGLPELGLRRRIRRAAAVFGVAVALGLAGVAGWRANAPRERLVASVRPPQPPPEDWLRQAPLVPASIVNPKDGLTYIHVPAGSFVMGCSPGDQECFDDEKPPHPVTITKGFYIGETEVTQQAYRRVTSKAPSNFKGDQLPVEQVSWDDAKSYCETVGLRLPTEAEWEYAARAGATGAQYGKLGDVAWYDGNSDSKTHPVKGKAANEWGLYDMLGNVSEWVEDWYGETYYKNSPVTDPGGPPSGTQRGLRGGSWSLYPRFVRVSGRGRVVPALRGVSIGFRCAGELR